MNSSASRRIGGWIKANYNKCDKYQDCKSSQGEGEVAEGGTLDGNLIQPNPTRVWDPGGLPGRGNAYTEYLKWSRRQQSKIEGQDKHSRQRGHLKAGTSPAGSAAPQGIQNRTPNSASSRIIVPMPSRTWGAQGPQFCLVPCFISRN